MFINLTNHPSSGWGEEQLTAARQYGEVIDCGFPAVAPERTKEGVCQLADDVVRDIQAMVESPEQTVAHVMGEHTLTFALVSRLKALGIRCVASTTERNTIMMPDGKKVSEFKFVQFRKY